MVENSTNSLFERVSKNIAKLKNSVVLWRFKRGIETKNSTLTKK